MRTWLRTVIVLLLALVVAGVPAAAQTPEGAGIDITTLPGVQRAVSRTYTFDVSSLTDLLETPTASLRAPSGAVLIVGIVAAFDTPEHAAAAVRTIGEGSLGGRDDQRLGATPVTDLGDSGIRLGGPGNGEALGVYVVQEANWLTIAIVSSTDDSSDATARGIVTYALAHPAGPDDGEFHADGSSRGGLWARLPSADDEDVLAGAAPLIDAVLVPVPGAGTPPA